MRFESVVLLLPLLAGCSLAPLGEGDFSCPRDRYGVHCLSAREVYRSTNTTDRLGADATAPALAPTEPAGGEHWGDQNGKNTPVATSGGRAVAAEIADNPSLTSAAVPRSDDPLPLRTPAQVLRIWVAPFEDDTGNLHAPGYVFAEVVPRRWQLGQPALAAGTPGSALQPLQVERRETDPTVTKDGVKSLPLPGFGAVGHGEAMAGPRVGP